MNRPQPTSIKGLSTENMRQAHVKGTGALGVSGTTPTCQPSCGTGTAVQDPDGFGGCWQRCWAPNHPPAAPHSSGYSREEPVDPGPNALPRGRSCPGPGRCAQRRLSPFHALQTCKAPARLSLVPARCRVPAGTALSPRGRTGQLHQGSKRGRMGAGIFPLQPKPHPTISALG